MDYGAVTIGEGASCKWASESSGRGSIHIIKTESPYYIKTERNLHERGKSVTEWTFQQNGDASTFVWSVESDIVTNPVSKHRGLMMKGMIKSDFQRRLANMKDLLEKE